MNLDVERLRSKELTRILTQDAALAMNPPKIISPVPCRYWPEVDNYTMSAGFARTPGGRIFLSWFAVEDGSEAVMLVTYSDNEGVSWKEPQFLVNPGRTSDDIHISALVGNLWVDPCGKLWWFFTQSIGAFDGRAGSWAAVCENPDDSQPCFREPFRIWHGAGLNKPTVLAGGEWILPLSLWPRRYIGVNNINSLLHLTGFNAEPQLYAELDNYRGANVLSSNDKGKSWEWRGRQRAADATFDENMILEMKNGLLRMYARDENGIVSCVSDDGGRNWSPFKREFKAASARFFVRALGDGRWLMVRLNSSGVRSHLTAYLSDDEGASWYGGLELDPREGVSYPDGFLHPDGRIFIQYDRLRERGEILMAVFTAADVAAGKDVSRKVVLQKPILQSYSCRTDIV